MITGKKIAEIPANDILGESVQWHAVDNTVWWTDIEGRRVHRLEWPSQKLTTYETPERMGCFARFDSSETVLVAGFETGFALFTPDTGHVKWLDKPAGLKPGVRLNDGRSDPWGRFWAGAKDEDNNHPDAPRGVLYHLNGDGKAEARLGKLSISNGLCWSPDGRTIYITDSRIQTIYKADFDKDSAVFGPLSIFKVYTDGYPDGAVTDNDGNLWVAVWAGARVDGFDPSGQKIGEVKTGAPHTSCPAFGGENGNLLFVTSARDELSEDALKSAPSSGSLFVYEMPVSGPASPPVINLTS